MPELKELDNRLTRLESLYEDDCCPFSGFTQLVLKRGIPEPGASKVPSIIRIIHIVAMDE